LAPTCNGARVHTIESFDDDPLMMSLRQAFSRHHALQCGYCTPGMLITAYDIVRRLPQADERRIREELSGNLCRCTGYMGIVAAIEDVLGHEPPKARLQPMRRLPATAGTDVVAAEGVKKAPTSDANAAPLSKRPIVGGTKLERNISLAVSANEAWAVLSDVRRVAACLPGARIESQDGDIVKGAFAVAIGPMKATFNGQATVAYDRAAQGGTVAGSGGDPTSRSSAEGALSFGVAALDTTSCVVAATLTYRLKGPLAQFGRPALVANVVDGLLAVFARNLVALAHGEAPIVAAPVGGVALVFRALSALIMQRFRRPIR
jgi:carbon-monoxide dehydrogenase small subunit